MRGWLASLSFEVERGTGATVAARVISVHSIAKVFTALKSFRAGIAVGVVGSDSHLSPATLAFLMDRLALYLFVELGHFGLVHVVESKVIVVIASHRASLSSSSLIACCIRAFASGLSSRSSSAFRQLVVRVPIS